MFFIKFLISHKERKKVELRMWNFKEQEVALSWLFLSWLVTRAIIELERAWDVTLPLHSQIEEPESHSLQKSFGPIYDRFLLLKTKRPLTRLA